MKIRISVSEEKYEAVRDWLAEKGVETGEDGEFRLTALGKIRRSVYITETGERRHDGKTDLQKAE